MDWVALVTAVAGALTASASLYQIKDNGRSFETTVEALRASTSELDARFAATQRQLTDVFDLLNRLLERTWPGES